MTQRLSLHQFSPDHRIPPNMDWLMQIALCGSGVTAGSALLWVGENVGLLDAGLLDAKDSSANAVRTCSCAPKNTIRMRTAVNNKSIEERSLFT
jgi:hypothetical protein